MAEVRKGEVRRFFEIKENLKLLKKVELTDQQRRIMDAYVKFQSAKKAAEEVGMSQSTVSNTAKEVKEKIENGGTAGRVNMYTFDFRRRWRQMQKKFRIEEAGIGRIDNGVIKCEGCKSVVGKVDKPHRYCPICGLKLILEEGIL